MESLYVKENEDTKEVDNQSDVKGKGKVVSKGQKGKPDTRVDYLNKLARGEIDGSSSEESESEDESDAGSSENDSDSDNEVYDRKQKRALAIPSITKDGHLDLGLVAAESDEDEPQYDTSDTIESNRIAIQNCDWDNISAKDIMAILLSFCPTGKTVKSVSVFYSDFGLQRIQEEEEVGPQGIWLEDKTTSSDEEEYDSEEEEELEESEEAVADISRKPGQVGIVWEDENKDKKNNKNKKVESESESEEDSDEVGSENGDINNLIKKNEILFIISEEEEDDENSDMSDNSEYSGNDKFQKQDPLKIKTKKVVSDFNEVAVRKYELSKLKYCFAVVTCDSSGTAAYLYEQLDGIEFHNSSMEFDLSLIPDEVDFTTRKCKDECRDFSSSVYEPPADFVVNALQHTSVECSWDKGESHREKKLTQISQWRKLQDSDFAQYIASESESEEEEELSNKLEREIKAKEFRRALLGGSDSEDEPDDFFQIEDKEEEEDEGVHKTFSFVPKDEGKDETKKTKKERRKEKLQEEKEQQEQGDQNQNQNQNQQLEEDAKSKALLQLMLTDENQGGSGDTNGNSEQYNMHDIRKAEMKRLKKEEKRLVEYILGYIVGYIYICLWVVYWLIFYRVIASVYI